MGQLWVGLNPPPERRVNSKTAGAGTLQGSYHMQKDQNNSSAEAVIFIKEFISLKKTTAVVPSRYSSTVTSETEHTKIPHSRRTKALILRNDLQNGIILIHPC